MCHVLFHRAENAENGEINKVRNQLTNDFGSVPETARYYKVGFTNVHLTVGTGNESRQLKLLIDL